MANRRGSRVTNALNATIEEFARADGYTLMAGYSLKQKKGADSAYISIEITLSRYSGSAFRRLRAYARSRLRQIAARGPAFSHLQTP